MRNFIRKKIIIRKKAFSLIEVSVVIMLLSVIAAGMLSVFSNAVTNDKTKKSKENIDLIYKALGAYLLKNGALPCPAPITSVKSTDLLYGKEGGILGACADQDGVYNNQNLVYGMVPIKDLDLPRSAAEDGFGNKFGYLIYKDFTDPALFGTASSNAKGIDVKNNATSLVNPSELAIFAIISYGANKYGAFNANSATQNSASTLASEQANYPTNLDNSPAAPSINTAIFSISATNKITLNASSATTSSVFDDIVFFKTRNDMIRDFNGFFLVKCPAVAANSSDANKVSYGGVYMAWASGGLYGQIVLSNTNCPAGWKATVDKPGRRCGAFGLWEVGGDYDGIPDPASITIPCSQ